MTEHPNASDPFAEYINSPAYESATQVSTLGTLTIDARRGLVLIQKLEEGPFKLKAEELDIVFDCTIKKMKFTGKKLEKTFEISVDLASMHKLLNGKFFMEIWSDKLQKKIRVNILDLFELARQYIYEFIATAGLQRGHDATDLSQGVKVECWVKE